LTPDFHKNYPDGTKTPHWPQKGPDSLSELAQSAPYSDVFALPFENLVLTTTSFGMGNHFANCRKHPELLKHEEDEFYELTKYLLKTYQGKNKVFVLKHWEGDWMLLHSYDAKKQADDDSVLDMIAWLKARQAGVSRARKEIGTLANVAVYNAVEVNRVLDYSRLNLDRVVNLVLPKVGADMVSYSSYDAMLSGSAIDMTTTKANLSEALLVIDKYAPDPLGLGRKRIFISEFGLNENKMKAPEEAVWRTRAVLEAARDFGASFAFFWELYDNACKSPIASSLSARPTNSSCKGFWLVKPDGHPSDALSVLKPYFLPKGI
jgi:hypothetical protein